MTTAACHACRAPVAAGDRFCTACGAPLTRDAVRHELGDLTGVLPVGRSLPSLIAGYLGLFAWAVIPAPFAILVGAYALWDLKRRPHLLGRGRAVFAIVAGVVGGIWGLWLFTL